VAETGRQKAEGVSGGHSRLPERSTRRTGCFDNQL
jgi:hypothetical protein